MGRRRATRRRVLRDDSSSDEEDIGEILQQPTVDPKIALTKADLSNATRDRLTAHDLRADRNFDVSQVERGRKCNHKGSAEAKNAIANRVQLSGWNSFGGTDSTTNLEDIAGGQYHRLGTTQKVQAETRELRIGGIEVNAESIDARNTNRVPRDTRPTAGRGRGGSSRTKPQSYSPRPLDPAIDPERTYTYKTGPAYQANSNVPARGSASTRGGRAGRTSGRGGHVPQLSRNPPGDPSLTPADIASVSYGPHVRSDSNHHKQRNTQGRQFSPTALVGNPEALRHLTAQLSPSPPPTIASPPRSSKKKKKPKGASKPKSEVAAQIASTGSKGVSPLVNLGGSNRLIRSTALRAVVNPDLAQNFSSWFKPGDSSSIVQTAQPEVPAGLSRSTSHEISVKVAKTQSKMTSREKSRSKKAQLSEGRLTPITQSDSVSAENASQYDEDMDSLHHEQEVSPAGVAIEGRQANADILLNDEALAIGQVALHLSGSQFFETSANSHQKDTLETEAEIAGSPSGSRPSTQQHVTTIFANQSSTIADVPGPIVRGGSSQNIAIDNPNHSQQPGISAALRYKSPNIGHDNTSGGSKPAASSSVAQIKPFTASETVKEPGTVSTVTSTSMLGDDSIRRRRGASSVMASSALVQSRYATESLEQSKQTNEPLRPFFKIQRTGPGYDNLVSDLQGLGMQVTTHRRPEETAFTKPVKPVDTAKNTEEPKRTGGLLFPQQRKDFKSESDSDNEL